MLGSENFIRYIIGTFLTLFLMINIIYAFDLTNSIGIPIAFDNHGMTYTDKYFGVMNLIDSYQYWFDDNMILSKISELMNKWYSYMNTLSIGQIFGFTTNWGADESNDILGALISLFNIFINVPYTLMIVIYFLIFLVYILLLIITFLGFVLYLLSGAVSTPLTNTEFPSVEEIMTGTQSLLRFLPIY